MDMCIDGIYGIVSHILGENSNLTSEQVKDAIIKLNPDFINDKNFMDMYPNIYSIVFCEIKLGLYKSRLELKEPRQELKLCSNRLICDVYDPDINSMEVIMLQEAMNQFFPLEKTIDDLWSCLIKQEENKKREYHKKCQNKITQKMTNQRTVTKQKQRITKFRKY
uniref:Uncharacterized protein n=1 Tax=Borely moumouvirus TaxID=2712067 RepID=A0A6G6ACL9_9VIRU